MRVLWFTNAPYPGVRGTATITDSSSGGWMWALADALTEFTPIELAIATAVPDGKTEKHVEGRITHYTIGVPFKKFTKVMERRPDSAFIEACCGVVDDFRPELVHIHGSELTYGVFAAQGHIAVPTILSLQGILNDIFPQYLADLTIRQLFESQSVYNWPTGEGLFFDWWRFSRRLNTEKSILTQLKNFTGQTLWDESHLRALNPSARYFRADRVLRSSFYTSIPTPRASVAQTIFGIWGQYPIKGTHVLLQGFCEARKRIPGLKLQLAGAQFYRTKRLRFYYTLLDDLIRNLGIEDAVELMPRLTGGEMAECLAASAAFILPSFIENESNSAMEAMLVGTPVIASFVGGLASTITDEKTGLFFPVGDCAVLAEQIVRIVSDTSFAQKLADNAREVALKRYDRKLGAERMTSIYESLLSDTN